MMQFVCDTKVKVRTVGEDCQIGPFRFGCPHQLPELPIDSRDMVNDLHQTDYSETGSIYHLTDSGIAQPRSRAAEEIRLGMKTSESRN